MTQFPSQTGNTQQDLNNIFSYLQNVATDQYQAYQLLAWTPVYTGYSSNPTVSSARTMVFGSPTGKLAYVQLEHSAYGTSNATTLTIQFPYPALLSQTLLGGRIRDNGGYSTTIGTIVLTSGSNIATVFRDMTGTPWTAANGKGADFTVIYPTP